VDGRLAYVSGPMTGVTPPATVAVDLTGVEVLRLVVVDGGDGNLNDEVDWADARVTCSGPGAAPPAAPSAMSALAAGQMAGLWWTPVPGAAFYRLEAGSASGASDLAVLDVPANAFTAAVPSGTFWVRVRAVNAWGVSAASPDARLAVDGTTSLPESPDALVATVSGGGVVSLQWTPPTTGGLPADYVIEAGTRPDALAAVVRTAVPAFAAAGVPAGTYYLRVRSANGAGRSDPTPVVTVVVP
jgi:NPCBM/NEW2 domain